MHSIPSMSALLSMVVISISTVSGASDVIRSRVIISCVFVKDHDV